MRTFLKGYDFRLTSRFPSDPLERRYGQYRQMSGGRFLIGLKDATLSEKITKIKILLTKRNKYRQKCKKHKSR